MQKIALVLFLRLVMYRLLVLYRGVSPAAIVILALLVLIAYGMPDQQRVPTAGGCTRWVAPPPAGNDGNPGTFQQPWATMAFASETVPDNNCTVWFKDGLYVGNHRLNRRFATGVHFQAVHAYRALFENNGSVVNISGGTKMTLEGFIFQHDGPGASQLVVIVDGSDEGWAEEIVLRNNIFRNSYNNDLLKLLDGVRFSTVEGNLFYNQGPNDDHLDVNSVTDITIRDNIFFNDFAGSGLPDPGDTKAFITVKDSNEGSDGLLGSERVAIRRNIFLNWQGDVEPFLQIGNDGKAYHEAKEVWIENNLMIGNSPDDVNALLAVSGARDVYFTNNTVTGDLPSRAYAFRVDRKDQNPLNENLFLYNNVWSDPTGTMGAGPSSTTNEFSDGDAVDIDNVVLDNNLYWNGGDAIPPGDLVSPLIDDPNRTVADPLLNTDLANIVLPRWNGGAFLSGNTTIRQEFVRLVLLYGRVPAGSPAANRGNPAYAPPDDILGQQRLDAPDLGAYESGQRFNLFLPLIAQ